MAKGLGTVIVVLNLPRSIPKILIRLQSVIDSIEQHPSIFVKPSPPLAQMRTHLGDLSNKQAAFHTMAGTKATRDEALKVVLADAKRVRAYVEDLANADPEQAEVIASAATMTVRQTPPRHKPALEVRQFVSAVVKLIAKAIRGGKSYQWQYRLTQPPADEDDGKWIPLPPTTQTSTTVENLAPGTTVWFRFRALLTTGLTNWSDAVSYLVR
jgi:hypothetical protein